MSLTAFFSLLKQQSQRATASAPGQTVHPPRRQRQADRHPAGRLLALQALRPVVLWQPANQPGWPTWH